MKQFDKPCSWWVAVPNRLFFQSLMILDLMEWERRIVNLVVCRHEVTVTQSTRRCFIFCHSNGGHI